MALRQKIWELRQAAVRSPKPAPARQNPRSHCAASLPRASSRLFTFAALLCLAGHVSLAAAQTVAIQGTVQDSTGGVLRNAIVELYQNQELVVRTDSGADGRFRVEALPGEYRIQVTALNFGMLARDLEVRPGMTPLTLQLNLAPVLQILDVEEEPFQISLEPDRNLTGLVLDDTAIQQLPEDEEELLQLLQDMAGPGADAVGGIEISTDGFTGGRLPPRDQIQEIRINNNPFTSERSRPGHGRIEIITRAGTDAMRGSVSFQFRDESLNARNAFADIRPPYQQRRWRVNLSGPVMRERMSFSLFATRSDSEDSDSLQVTTLSGPVSAAVVHPNVRQEYNGRMQYQLPSNHSLNLALEYGTDKQENEGVGGFTLPEQATESDSNEWNLQVREIAPLSERMVHETRFSLRRERSKTTPVTDARSVRVLDAFNGGGATDFNRDMERNYQFADQLSYVRGPLSLKAGFQGDLRQYETLNQDNFRGTFVFSDLDAFAAGRPLTFTRNSGDPVLDMNQFEWALFAQNDYRVSEKLLLSFGLRYENQTHLGDHNNLDPRFGFAYGIGGSSVIRGGAGIFHQRLSAGTVQSVMRLDGARQVETVLRYCQPDDLAETDCVEPSYPEPFATGGSGTATPPESTRQAAGDLAAPYTANASISFETRLPKGLFVSAGYDFVRGIHLYRGRDINAPLPGQAERPDPTRGNIILLESSARSRYHELSLRVNQRLGSSSFNFNYTLSSNYDDTGGTFSLPASSYDLSGEWGRSSQQQRHSVFAGYNFNLPWRISANTRVRLSSGRPYNITTGSDDNGDTHSNDRPTGISRNSGDGPGNFEVDLGLRKTFALRRSQPRQSGARQGSSAEAAGRNFQGGGANRNGGRRDTELSINANISNLFNHTNFSRYSGVMSSPYFGRANSARSPREVELGIQINF